MDFSSAVPALIILMPDYMDHGADPYRLTERDRRHRRMLAALPGNRRRVSVDYNAAAAEIRGVIIRNDRGEVGIMRPLK